MTVDQATHSKRSHSEKPTTKLQGVSQWCNLWAIRALQLLALIAATAALPFDQFSLNWSQNLFLNMYLCERTSLAWWALTLFGGISINMSRVLILNTSSNEAINSKMVRLMARENRMNCHFMVWHDSHIKIQRFLIFLSPAKQIVRQINAVAF